MAISFEQPEPFAPNLSAAYGAAEMAQRNNAVLQRGASDIASLYEQQAGRAQQSRMQQAALRNQAASDTARIQSVNENRAADAADQARQMQANRLHESQLQEGRLTFAQDEANANRQQGIYDMQERADLQNWLGQQEMTQAESMRLNRMENAVSEVMADPSLDPEEKHQYVRQLRTGIDSGKQKMMQTQQKQMELENQRLESQAMQELKVRALEAKTLPERTQTIYDQNMTTAIQPAVEAEFDKAFPNVAMMPMGQQLRAAAIQKEVWERVAAAGGATQYIQDSPGKFQPVKHPRDEKPERFDRKAHEEEAQNEADKAVPRTAGPTGKLEESIENNDYKFKVLKRMEDEFNRSQQKPAREPWAGTPFAGRMQQAPSQQPVQQVQGELPPVPQDKMPVKPRTEQPTFDVKDATANPTKLTEPQQNQMATWRASRAVIEEAPVPPEVKKGHLEHVEWAERKLAEHGSMWAMAEKAPNDFRRYFAIMNMIPLLPKGRPRQPGSPEGQAGALMGQAARGSLQPRPVSDGRYIK